MLNALVKYLLTNDYSIVQIMWMRSVVHMAWMLVLFLPYGGIRLLRSNRPGLQLVALVAGSSSRWCSTSSRSPTCRSPR